MRNKNWAIPCGAIAIAVFLVALSHAEPPTVDDVNAALLKAADSKQQMLKLPVRVVDPDGKPVAKAKVTPWALRSSQGHGPWRKDDKAAGVGPQDAVTDDDGNATVLYPRHRYLKEQIKTLQVSLFVDHPDYAYADDLHIDVPLETKGSYEIKLNAGSPLEVRPLIDSKPADLASIFGFWSDGRSWRTETGVEKTADGKLRLPTMSAGKNSVVLAKLDGDRATHFSKITDFELTAGEKLQLDVPLVPSVRIQGKLSDNVPRPVQGGRIKVNTLAPAAASDNRVTWLSWAPIAPDGTFTIDGWPAGERLQLIALCDGYIATSGKAPDVIKNPPDPKSDSFERPQVFDADPKEPIEVAMTPLVPCVVKVVDEDGKPVAGIKVVSWPNVGWWNWGSQVYGSPLARGERLLRVRDYDQAIDKDLPPPFTGTTASNGQVTLQIPVGHEELSIDSDVYELPVFLGQRSVCIDLVAGKTTTADLRLQPAGTEKLGEWDKLAGVVFGCSTREGRRICALPGVRAKMDEFAKRFQEGKSQRDPQLLSEAYAAVADAFAGVGDQDEATKWRLKSADQAAKAKPAAGNQN